MKSHVIIPRSAMFSRFFVASLSKVAEDLLSLVPVHRGRSLLAAAGEELLPGLSSGGAQAQATLYERV